MSWIEDLHKERTFTYENESGDILRGTISNLSELAGRELSGDPGETFVHDDLIYTYAGFDNVPLQCMTKVMYEKNGRKAYHIKDSSGKNRYIAKSKDDYLKHGEMNGKKLQRMGKASLLKGEPNDS